MNAIPSKDNIQDAFYAEMATLRNESRVIAKAPDYLTQLAPYLGAERVARTIVTAKRLAAFHLSGAELARLYSAQVDARLRLVSMIDRPAADVFRFEALADVLDPEEAAEEAGDAAYAEAIDFLFGQEKAHAILSSIKIQSAAELKLKKLPPPRWTIERLLPEGLAMLSAPPKAGKSWLALALAVDVASGLRAFGRLPVVNGRALFLGLEDSDRRLQSRLERLGGAFPAALDIITEIPQGIALTALLDAWLAENDDARLVVLDTLGRSLRGVNLSDYGEVTRALDPIQRLAFKHGVSILVIHHNRKGTNEGDVFDAALGSQGNFGAMDAAFILQRKRGEDTAVLHVTGREIGDASYSLEIDSASMQWRMTDKPPEEILQGPERRAILEILRKAGPEGARPGEIAKHLGRAQSTVSTLLGKLKEESLVYSPKYGFWKVIDSVDSVDCPTVPSSIQKPTIHTNYSIDDSSSIAKADTLTASSARGETEEGGIVVDLSQKPKPLAPVQSQVSVPKPEKPQSKMPRVSPLIAAVMYGTATKLP